MTPPGQTGQGRVSVTVVLFQSDCVVVTGTDWLTVTIWVVTVGVGVVMPGLLDGSGRVLTGPGVDVVESLPAWRR